jgi:indole-3-glycerol phosphate synthase
MNNILEKICKKKRQEVELRKKNQLVSMLENSTYYSQPAYSLSNHIKKSSHGIIAEFKRKSPSRGIINPNADIRKTTKGYIESGASALSVLTDETFFGGSLENLRIAKEENGRPILQKDFVLDPYQVIEAKAHGADAILLIANLLSKKDILDLSEFAVSLGMEVLFEIHNKEEIRKIPEQAHLIGINNRNLQNFDVNQENAMEILRHLPNKSVKIAESGINSPWQAYQLLNNGFDGLLIGEAFMKQEKPDEACKKFINQLESIEKEENI